MQDELFLDCDDQGLGGPFGRGVSFAKQKFSQEQCQEAKNGELSEDRLVGNGLYLNVGIRHVFERFLSWC